MNGLGSSLFFIIAFMTLVGGAVAFPKVERELSLLAEGLMGVVLIMCYGAVTAGVFKVLHIPIDLNTIGIAYAVPALLLWVLIIRKKKIQKLTISKLEIISVFLLSLVFFAVELTVFSFEMRPSYNYNTDAGNHLGAALDIVRTKEVKGMFFAALHNALTIEVFQPFLEEIKYYKGFVFADSLHYYFEILFIYAIIFGMAKKKVTKLAAPVITALCWFGYPLYSYIEGHYVYWGWGVILLGFMLYELNRFLEYRENGKWCAVKLIMGFSGVVLCYSLFAPFILWILLIIGIMEWKRGNIKLNRKVWLGIGAGTAFCAAVAVFGYFSFFGGYSRETSIFASLRTEGGCYMNLYSDFIWTLPVILIFYICGRKMYRYQKVYGAAYISAAVFQMILLAAFFTGFISAYYYYKFYYPLWLLHWIVIAMTIDCVTIKKEEKKYIYAYGVVLALVHLSCFGQIPERLNDTGAGWFSEESSIGNNLYSRNTATLQSDFEAMKYSLAQFEICAYVMDNLRDTGRNVSFAGWKDCMGQGNWYSAITGMQNNLTYRMVEAEGENWKKILDGEKLKYYVVLKTSDLYKENQEYFETKNRIFENEEGFIVEN